MLVPGVRAPALAVLCAGCAFGDAGQSTGGAAPPAAGGSSSASASGTASGGGGGSGGSGATGGVGGSSSSASSATGGRGSAAAGGGGGEAPCANSADCGGQTCCQKFEGARLVHVCVSDSAQCRGLVLCATVAECIPGDNCCDERMGYDYCGGCE